MHSRLHSLFDLLESDRIVMSKNISTLSQTQFDAALPGKWSIHQILSHLITAEKLSLQYMKKKVLGIDAADESGLVEEGKMAMLWISQRLPFKFKAPRVVIDHSRSYSDIAELVADWEQERRELNIFLESFKDHQLKKKIYKHIRVGMLNIQHALLFYREHYLHHLPQIKRLL